MGVKNGPEHQQSAQFYWAPDNNKNAQAARYLTVWASSHPVPVYHDGVSVRSSQSKVVWVLFIVLAKRVM